MCDGQTDSVTGLGGPGSNAVPVRQSLFLGYSNLEN